MFVNFEYSYQKILYEKLIKIYGKKLILIPRCTGKRESQNELDKEVKADLFLIVSGLQKPCQ